MHIKLLHNIREYELSKLFSIFNFDPNAKLLEIGSGTGHQLEILKTKVFQSFGIDLVDGTYSKFSISEIISYDGSLIPFDAATFDYVFSSNTLEHIKEIKLFEIEMRRVTKENGFAIHILPTSTWAFYTITTHFIFVMKKITAKLLACNNKKQVEDKNITETRSTIQMNAFRKILNLLFPKRHGETGNYISEIYYFSERYWKSHFTENNWTVIKVIPSGVFYTGNQIYPNLDFRLRCLLSKTLGSSTNIYILKKN